MKNVYKALLQVQSQGITVSKDATNPYYKSKYTTLDNIINSYSKVLTDNGLIVSHHLQHGLSTYLVTEIIHTESGESIGTGFELKKIDDIQKMGSQITYAKRYNLGQLLNIATDEDDDGNKNVEKKEKPKMGKENFEKLKEAILAEQIQANSYEELLSICEEKYIVGDNIKTLLKAMFTTVL